MTNQQKFSRLRKILDDASVYGRSIGKLNFDMQCCAPEEGMEQAGEDIAVPIQHGAHRQLSAGIIEVAVEGRGNPASAPNQIAHQKDAQSQGQHQRQHAAENGALFNLLHPLPPCL